MADTSKIEKTIINYSVLKSSEDKIKEICQREDRNPGWVFDKAMEIAYPVLLGLAVVNPASTKTE